MAMRRRSMMVTFPDEATLVAEASQGSAVAGESAASPPAAVARRNSIRSRQSSVTSLSSNGGGSDRLFATVAVLMDEHNSRATNDFLAAWDKNAHSALMTPAAVLLHVPWPCFEAINRCWHTPPAAQLRGASAAALALARRRRALEGVRIGMRRFVTLFAPALIMCGAYDADGSPLGPALGILGKDAETKTTHDIAAQLSLSLPMDMNFDDAMSAATLDSNVSATSAALEVEVEQAELLIQNFVLRDDVSNKKKSHNLDGGPLLRQESSALIGLSTNTPLVNFLCDLFEMVDTKRTGFITWEQLVTFVIERVYSHDTSGTVSKRKKNALEEDDADLRVNPVTGTKCTMQFMGQVEMTEPEGQQFIHRLSHFPDWDAVVALSHQTAAVYLIEDVDAYVLDLEAAAAGDAVRRRRLDGNIPWAKRRQALAKKTQERALSRNWGRNVFDTKEADVCKAQYFHSPGTIHCCEYLSSIGIFVTVCNSVEDQLALHSVHLRKDVNYTRRIRVPVDSHINVLKEFNPHRNRGGVSKRNDGSHDGTTDDEGDDEDDETEVLSTRASHISLTNDPQSEAATFLIGMRNGRVAYAALPVEASRRASRQKELRLLGSIEVHKDEITDAIVVPRTGRVVTSSLDCTVAVHSPSLGIVSRYVGHAKGVTTLAYSSTFEVFLSGGYEYHALCWAENLANSPAFALVDTTNPHCHPLCRIIAVEGTPQVYTVDVSGVVKLFDVRSLKVLDSWRAFDAGRVPLEVSQDVHSSGSRETSHLGDVGSVCYTGPRHRSILFGAKHFYLFHTEVRSADAQRAHDSSDPILGVQVGRRLFITASSSQVKSWSVRNGIERCAQQSIRYTSSAVRCLTYDNSTGLIFTGHQDGSIFCLHAETGIVTRRYLKHETRVVALAIDELHGILISASVRGEVLFWDIVDRGSAPRSAGGHLSMLTGNLTPLPSKCYRDIELPPMNQSYSSVLWSSVTPDLRERTLSRWVIHRWQQFVNKRRTGNPRLANQGTSQASLISSRPRSSMFLRYPATKIVVAPRYMRCLMVSTKANARIVDYSTPKPDTACRMFHGTTTELTSCAYWPERNLAVVSDSLGALYAWLCAKELEAPILLGKWFNRCQLTSYSHPLNDIFRAEEQDALDGVGLDDEAVEVEEEVNELNEELMREAQTMTSDSPVTTAPVGAIPGVAGRRGGLRGGDDDTNFRNVVPAISALYIDPIRGYLMTGDDVGYVSLYELETLYSGPLANAALALCAKESTGNQPRFIHSWRAHQHPVIHLGVLPHTMYCVVSAATDNIVALWTPDGGWVAGLRQGPIVDRQWRVPNAEIARKAWIRLRYSKLYNCCKDGLVKEIVLTRAPPKVYGFELLGRLRSETEQMTLKQLTMTVKRGIELEHRIAEVQEKRRRSSASRGVPLAVLGSRQRKRIGATLATFDARTLPSLHPTLRFNGEACVGGDPTGEELLYREDDTIDEAEDLHAKATEVALSTNGVVQALKRAYNASNVQDPDVDTNDSRIIEADRLKDAQRGLGKYRQFKGGIPEALLAAQASMQNIAKAQEELAQKHLKQRAALEALPHEVAERVRLCCGTVSVGNLEVNVRFPALGPEAPPHAVPKPVPRPARAFTPDPKPNIVVKSGMQEVDPRMMIRMPSSTPSGRSTTPSAEATRLRVLSSLTPSIGNNSASAGTSLRVGSAVPGARAATPGLGRQPGHRVAAPLTPLLRTYGPDDSRSMNAVVGHNRPPSTM